jgi:hypothetical protein
MVIYWRPYYDTLGKLHMCYALSTSHICCVPRTEASRVTVRTTISSCPLMSSRRSERLDSSCRATSCVTDSAEESITHACMYYLLMYGVWNFERCVPYLTLYGCQPVYHTTHIPYVIIYTILHIIDKEMYLPTFIPNVPRQYICRLGAEHEQDPLLTLIINYIHNTYTTIIQSPLTTTTLSL